MVKEQIIRKLIIIVFPPLFFLLSGCSETPAEVKPDNRRYFDLKGFFDQEIQQLSRVTKVKKIAVVDGVREERIIDSLNFEDELEIFSNADINRPAWSDKYRIDSIFNDEKQLAQLRYTATDEDLRTQKILVDLEMDKVSKIFIENSSSSVVADTRQLLTYIPATGYIIESHQQVTFTDDNSFLIEVQYKY